MEPIAREVLSYVIDDQDHLVKVGGDWVEVEEAAARLGLSQRQELPMISHGICPDCGEMLMAA